MATIIGVPPGYVGNDQGGRLVNELNADPYCVFLLDEADKAHPVKVVFRKRWVTPAATEPVGGGCVVPVSAAKTHL